jgi:signal transduction histidine kinase
MDEESLNFTKEKIDLSALVEVKVKEFEVLAKSKGLVLKNNIEPGVVFCGDEPSIRQLVSILLDNACKYAIDYIEVSLYNSKGKINLIVYNKAECVKKGSLDNYFDRFYRGDLSHNKEVEGFGIGLSIAASIVAMHKGRISGVSEDGESVKFKVTL